MRLREQREKLVNILEDVRKGMDIDRAIDKIARTLVVPLAPINEHTFEHYRGLFELMHPEIRRSSDTELKEWLVYMNREIIDCGEDGYEVSRKAMLSLLEDEAQRRISLAARGGPRINTNNGAHLSKSDIEELKRYFTGGEFIRLFEDITGIEVTQRAFMYSCPLHGDGRDRFPSGRLYPDQGKYWCFGCNTGGDIFQLYSDYKNMNFVQALKDLQSRIPDYQRKTLKEVTNNAGRK